MRSQVMQAWIEHTDGCLKCRAADTPDDLCAIGKEMSPAVEADIRHSMAQELREDELSTGKPKFPPEMYQGDKGHPQCCFFEAFASSAGPDCDFYGELFCHMSGNQEHAKICNGDYLLCPIAYGKSSITIPTVSDVRNYRDVNAEFWKTFEKEYQ